MTKALSLKLDEPIYREAEKIRKRLQLPRNAYIRKAISHYNAIYTRKLLAQQYHQAARRLGATRRLGAAHLQYLQETELLEDLPEDL